MPYNLGHANQLLPQLRGEDGEMTMLDRIITWLIKRLILLWDRHNDKIAFSFGRDERTDYSVLVERFYDDYYTVGTAMYPYNKREES